MRRAILIGALCAALSACAHDVALQSVCPPVKTYTPAEQKALAAELAALPPGSALGSAIVDYGRLRDASRACAKVAP